MRYFMSYIDDGFLDDFFKQKPTDMESESDELDIWRDWLSFVRNKTDIDLTTSINTKDLAYNINSSITRELIDDYFQGKPHITINTKKLETTSAKALVLNSQKPTFIFRNDLENIEITEAKTGFCYITGTCFFEKWRHYFKTKTYSISKNTTQNQLFKWSDLFVPYRYPSNAFVIVDNYIFSNKPNIKNNLLKILKELLMPTKQVSTEIDLIIIAESFYKEVNSNGSEISIDKLYKDVIKYLREDLKLYNFNLCIVKAKYHDRLILSNYFVINSGNSFNYFNYDDVTILPQNTRLSLTPFTYDYSFIDTYKDELSKIIENCEEFKGNKQNRLLKLFV